jgi:MbtH protein
MSSDETNPFDDENGTFLVLLNARGQYSLWPDFAPVPAGWHVEAGPDSRAVCLQFVEERWGSALRPGSVTSGQSPGL